MICRHRGRTVHAIVLQLTEDGRRDLRDNLWGNIMGSICIVHSRRDRLIYGLVRLGISSYVGHVSINVNH